MTEGIRKNEPDARTVYADIIDLPHHQSATHPHMSLYDRSAQFAPFAALTGYDDMISEEARLTGVRRAQNVMLLNTKLAMIDDAVQAGEHPRLGFTVFVPDERKEGGEYVELSGKVKRIEMPEETVVLFADNEKSDGIRIKIENLHDIYGEFVNHLEDSF